MTVVDINVDDVQELEVLNPGEYQVRIDNAEIRESDNPNFDKYLLLRLVPDEHPNAKSISHVIMLPCSQMDEREVMNRKRDIKNFVEAFNYNASNGINDEELVGLTGWALLGVENDDEYGEQNRVRRFVTEQ